MDNTTIILAGASGDLGGRIAKALLPKGVTVKALVRQSTSPETIKKLQNLGVAVVVVDFKDIQSMTNACLGGSCVVSALSGLRETIVEAQSLLLQAAIAAGVPRFIPSDYSIDFTKLLPGTNRNLDLRREFHHQLDTSSIAATTIFNGAFADMLTGQMPIILFKWKRILYWGNPDQVMDFTTKDNTAAFTAAAALDASTPRFLRIAGDQLSMRDLAKVTSEVTGTPFKLLRAGSLGSLSKMITFMRVVLPKTQAIYPPWQGMQYLHNMLEGRAKLNPLDNARYPGMQWTSAREVLAAR